MRIARRAARAKTARIKNWPRLSARNGRGARRNVRSAERRESARNWNKKNEDVRWPRKKR